MYAMHAMTPQPADLDYSVFVHEWQASAVRSLRGPQQRPYTRRCQQGSMVASARYVASRTKLVMSQVRAVLRSHSLRSSPFFNYRQAGSRADATTLLLDTAKWITRGDWRTSQQSRPGTRSEPAGGAHRHQTCVIMQVACTSYWAGSRQQRDPPEVASA